MEQVTPVDRDSNSIPRADESNAHSEPPVTSNGHVDQDDNTVGVKEEEEATLANGDDGGVTERPAKRRRVEDLTPRPSASRAVSPPWKPFAVDGPTTVFENGVRKSSRVNRETAPPTPEPSKRSSRQAAKSVQTNGTPKNGSKRETRKTPASGTNSSVKPSSTTKINGVSMATPMRKSVRQSRSSALAKTSSPISPATTQPTSTRRGPGRPRRSTQGETVNGSADATTNGRDPDAGLYAYPDENDPSMPAPRLRLNLRKLDLPNRHPRHAPPQPKFESIGDWLKQDDPLEGEENQRITETKAKEEAQRRLRIVEAAETGVLSQAQCSIFAPEAPAEPPQKYGHWDHVVAHALNFNKLLKMENLDHRRMAKAVAREAVEVWKLKFKRKTQEEIEQEETERQLLRYKQLVKDLKDSWALVRTEIDKERVARWEEQQRELGQKAMDDMFNQAQEILGRNVADTASSYVSEDREFDDTAAGSDSAASEAEKRSENDDDMMSSTSDSEAEDEHDEDANLTAEQLRAKYEQLPDFPQSSSEAESEEEDGNNATDDDSDGTPAPTPDVDLEMEDADRSESAFAHTNGHGEFEGGEKGPNYIDPATVQLEQVDEALLDSDDDNDGSESGSEAWSSNDDTDADADSERDDAEESEAESDEEDIGMMGFLAPKDIKKLKDAAKVAIEDEKMDDAEPEKSQIEEVNGHSAIADDSAVEESDRPKLNGHARQEETEANGEGAEELPASKEDEDVIMMDDATPDKSISRSRHASSPPRTEVPFLLRGTLREYQHDGLDWLANLYESDTNGILADEMGLGKTIQTISLLAYLAVRREIWGPHLVVVPTSVMLNWEMEFKKFLPGFKILTYYGDINERKRKRLGWRNTGKDMYNVVITSYQLILQDAAAFKMRAWQYLVLDEAHNIKNFKSQRWQTMLNLRTQRRLLLTGTPLQNNIDELWSLLYFLMPAGFAGEGRIAGLEEFTMALKNPTSQILDQGRQQLDAEAQRIVKKLHEVLRPYLLRRLKSEVEKQMPAKYEHVVYCKLSKRQRQLYDGFMGRADTKQTLSSGNYMSIINCLMSLRKVCNHPDLFETRAIVTSMAMPRSVTAQYEIKDFFVRRHLQQNTEDTKVNLDALNLVFARREQTKLWHARRSSQIRATRPLEDLIERQTRRINKSSEQVGEGFSLQSTMAAALVREQKAVKTHLQTCLRLTRSRTQFMPIYGKEIIDRCTMDWQTYTFGGITEGIRQPKRKLLPPSMSQPALPPNPYGYSSFNPPQPFGGAYVQPKTEQLEEFEYVKRRRGRLGFRDPISTKVSLDWNNQQISHFYDMIPTLEQRADALEPLIARFTCATPAVAAEQLAPLSLSDRGVQLVRSSKMAQNLDPFHESRIRQSIAFPDKRLLQYDCGKLQRLATLLRDLQAGGHRALIFTQMTKVLDILEQFLNIHGHRYLRLDGSTKVEQRQILTDRFNTDPRILCFILSSRSGGLGINLTGADTVIFYDLDWNPAMDKQCQDRAHRIGQTRDVHIYKFVSEYTIEANILRKSNQKRLLDDVIIQKGDFTTDTFNRVTWRDALDEGLAIDDSDEAGAAMERVLGEKAGLLGDSKVMGTVEDTEDRTAAHLAQKEIVDEIHDDQVDFNESSNATRVQSEAPNAADSDLDAFGNEKERRHVDEYMLGLYREEYGKEAYRPPTDRQKRHRRGVDPHVRTKKKRY